VAPNPRKRSRKIVPNPVPNPNPIPIPNPNPVQELDQRIVDCASVAARILDLF